MRKFTTDRAQPVHFVAYSAGGDWIVALAGGRRQSKLVQFWSLAKAAAIRFPGVPTHAHRMAVARRADVIAVNLREKIGVYSRLGRVKELPSVQGRAFTEELAVSEDGAVIAVGRVRVLEGGTTTRIELHPLYGGSRPRELGSSLVVGDLEFSPDGRLLACGGSEGFTIWDLTRGESILARPVTRGRCLAFSPDGRQLAVRSAEYVNLWDLGAVRFRQSLVGHQNLVSSLAFTPTGNLIATGALDRTVRFWDFESGHVIHTYDWQIGPVHSIAFSPDGLTCAAGGESGEVVIWDVED
jgi:WD40 repeat protein